MSLSFPYRANRVQFLEPSIVIDAENLEKVQEAIGYRFDDLELLAEALTHASVAEHRLKSNERLEFLGDAILGVVVCERLFELFPTYLEGELTKIKSAVVSRRTCSEIAADLGLEQFLLLGKGMTGRLPLPRSLGAAAYESVIAAIYLDAGLDAARDFILETISAHIREADESEHQRNFKSQLQQHAQKSLSATPVYEMLDEKGPDHSKCFEVCAALNGRRFNSAWGPSKREAEQLAARRALQELGVLEHDEEPDPTDEGITSEPPSYAADI